MKCSLSNTYTQRAVTSGMTIPQEWHGVYTVLPATHTSIHEWNEHSCIHFVSIHQMPSPKQGGTHLDQPTTYLSIPKGWNSELA